VKIRPTDDGLHLDGSILWLDSMANGELSFLSSAAHSDNSDVPQVIATEETVKILETKRRRPNALICQYNRPFSIGKLKMELLPSGSVLGGASLYVESDKGRILYAPQLQTQKIATVRQMQLKKAQTLIVGAFHPDPNMALPNRKRERERLLAVIKKYIAEGQYPNVLVHPISTAQELTKFLVENDIPVACHRAIHRVNRVYEAYGSHLGDYSLYNPRFKKNKRVILLPFEENRVRRPLPSGPNLYIEESFSSAGCDQFSESEDRFFISSTCDGRELREVISAVSPKEVFVFGPYAKSYAHELKNSCKSVKPLYSNDQPTLF
jgi:putative mRNA 3-end processing factor